jgi:hypothetical protein
VRVQGAAGGSIVERAIGVAKLDVPTYEAIEHDDAATQQALIVVIVVAIAGGIGALTTADSPILGLIGGIIAAILGWLIFSAVAYFVGTKMIPGENTEATIPQLLRCMGYAQIPGILGILGLIPILGIIAGIISFFWGLATAIVGLRSALDMSTGRAIAVGIISAIIAGIIVAIVLIPFGVASLAMA